MPTRSQRHLRQVQGYDSSGVKNPLFGSPITASTPPTATLTATGATGRTIATITPTGGKAPYTYAVTAAGGVSASFSPNTSNLLKTTVNPAGSVGVHNMTILITDAWGNTRSHALAVTLS